MKLLLGLVLCLGLNTAFAENKFETKLLGKWQSASVTGEVLQEGYIQFDKGGVVTLAPEGFEPKKGGYSVANEGWLVMDMSKHGMGSSTMAYTLSSEGSKKVLNLSYPNGFTQKFLKK